MNGDTVGVSTWFGYSYNEAIALAGERGERILGRIGDWMLVHWPAVVAPLTAVFGFAVLAFGIVQLASN